jgi:hypothetical protein
LKDHWILMKGFCSPSSQTASECVENDRRTNRRQVDVWKVANPPNRKTNEMDDFSGKSEKSNLQPGSVRNMRVVGPATLPASSKSSSGLKSSQRIAHPRVFRTPCHRRAPPSILGRSSSLMSALETDATPNRLSGVQRRKIG